MERKTVIVIFGGKSVEHDISVITGVQAALYLKATDYEVIPVYMRGDDWFIGKKLTDISSYVNFSEKGLKKVFVKNGALYIKGKRLIRKYRDIYCALITAHGGFGENGGLQGLFDVEGVAYTSSGVFGSSVAMKKHAAKLVAESLSVNTAEYMVLTCENYRDKSKIVAKITEELGEEVIVKPANLGSSIGITVAKDTKSLYESLESAFTFDDEVIIERALKVDYELNIALYKSSGKIVFGDIEKPVRQSEILSFEDKYVGGAKGMASQEREVPANITKTMRDSVRKYAAALYSELDLRGIVRMDFIVENGEVFFNEINSVPGSLALYLFDTAPNELLEEIIEESVAERNNKLKLSYGFESSVLSLAADGFGGGKGGKL